MAFTFKDLQDEVKRRSFRDKSSTEFDTGVKNIINTSILRIAREANWRQIRREGTITTKTSYTTGSGAVSVTNGSKNFSVTGATFLTDDIHIGRRISFGTDSRIYKIASITSETSGTIERDYDGTTSSTTTYEILPQEEYNLPIQSSHRIFLWHNDFGYPLLMDYVAEQEFRGSGVDDSHKGTPIVYRMWNVDMVQQQPKSAGTLSVASSDSGDTSVDITVFGTVASFPDFEIITTNSSNGTTSVTGSKSFSSVERVVKNKSTDGRITVTADSGNTDVATLPAGDSTAGIQYRKVLLYPLPDDVFDINVFYYKDPYRLVSDGDVHELGQDFDESIILLSVAKFRYEQSQREGDRMLNMYLDEIKSLKRVNVDKIDQLYKLQRPNMRSNDGLIQKNLTYSQLGGNFGPMLRR